MILTVEALTRVASNQTSTSNVHRGRTINSSSRGILISRAIRIKVIINTSSSNRCNTCNNPMVANNTKACLRTPTSEPATTDSNPKVTTLITANFVANSLNKIRQILTGHFKTSLRKGNLSNNLKGSLKSRMILTETGLTNSNDSDLPSNDRL